MSEEEKEAIENLGKDLKENIQEDNKIDNYKYVSNLYSNGDIEVVLNLIEKLQKVIDLMAEELAFKSYFVTKEGWKHHFYKKVEEEK